MADFIRHDRLAGGLGDGVDDRATLGDWSSEERYWRSSWHSRPYATADLGFEHFHGAYRYGYESAHAHRGRGWTDVEGDLRTRWDTYEHRGTRSWDDVKHAVRDAFDRIAHR